MILPFPRPSSLWFTPRDMIGQFFTPEPVVHLIYRLAQARAGQRVMDPSCGDGAFIRAAPAGCELFGCELDPRFHAALKEILPPRHFVLGDALTELCHLHGAFDLVIGNPPFSAQSHLERRARSPAPIRPRRWSPLPMPRSPFPRTFLPPRQARRSRRHHPARRPARQPPLPLRPPLAPRPRPHRNHRQPAARRLPAHRRQDQHPRREETDMSNAQAHTPSHSPRPLRPCVKLRCLSYSHARC